MNNKQQVVVAFTSDGNIRYWTGQYQNGTVQWMNTGQMFAGQNPAVTINNNGVVVMVYQSMTQDELWYCVGKLDDVSMDVTWRGSVKYDTGITPGIAIRDDGVIVEVHRSQNNEVMWYHVATLGSDMRITFYPSKPFPNKHKGSLPSIKFVGDQIHSIHQATKGGKYWIWEGDLSMADQSVFWEVTSNRETLKQSFKHHVSIPSEDKTREHKLSVGSRSDGSLYYEIDHKTDLIRPTQLCFVDIQSNSPELLTMAEQKNNSLWFISANSNSHPSFISKWKKAKKIVRLWGFNEAYWNTGNKDLQLEPNFAATDFPLAPKYHQYFSSIVQQLAPAPAPPNPNDGRPLPPPPEETAALPQTSPVEDVSVSDNTNEVDQDTISQEDLEKILKLESRVAHYRDRLKPVVEDFRSKVDSILAEYSVKIKEIVDEQDDTNIIDGPLADHMLLSELHRVQDLKGEMFNLNHNGILDTIEQEIKSQQNLTKMKSSVIQVQALIRGWLTRKRHSTSSMSLNVFNLPF